MFLTPTSGYEARDRRKIVLYSLLAAIGIMMVRKGIMELVVLAQ